MDSDTSTAMTSSRSAALWASAGPKSPHAAKAMDAPAVSARHPAGETSLADARACEPCSPKVEPSWAVIDWARPRHLSGSLKPAKFSTALQVLCPVFHDICCRDCYCPSARNVRLHELGCTWRTR